MSHKEYKIILIIIILKNCEIKCNWTDTVADDFTYDFIKITFIHNNCMWYNYG